MGHKAKIVHLTAARRFFLAGLILLWYYSGIKHKELFTLAESRDTGFNLRIPSELKDQAEKAIEILQADNIGKISLNAYFVDAIRRRTEEVLRRKGAER
jgi:hypothetical protein